MNTRKFYFVFVLPVSLVMGILNGVLSVWGVGVGTVLEHHQGIFNLTLESPYRYRILSHYVVQYINDLTGTSILLLYIVWYIIMTVALFTFCVNALGESKLHKLCAMFLLVCFLLVTYFPFFQPSTICEAVFVVLVILMRRNLIACFVLILFASLNRETAILLPLLMIEKIDKRTIINVAVAFAISLSVFVGLRVWLGNAPHCFSLVYIFSKNIANIPLFLVIFLLSTPVAVTISIKNHYIGILLFVAIYLVFLGVFGLLYEFRIYTPIFVSLLPSSAKKLSEMVKGD